MTIYIPTITIVFNIYHESKSPIVELFTIYITYCPYYPPDNLEKTTKKTALKKVTKRTLKTATRTTTSPVPTSNIFLASKAARSSTAAPDNGWTEGPKGVKRPISPSIQIWKFSPTAYLHVGSRITGAVLTGGMTIAGLYSIAVGCDIPAALDTIKINAPILVPLLKMSIVFPLSYHGLHGARQIWQDFTAKGYDAEFQEKSSYAIAGAATAATLYGGLAI